MVYIGFFTFIIVISVFFVFEKNGERQISDYKINCTASYTNYKSFFAERDANIKITQFESNSVYQFLSTETYKKIR